MENKVYCEVSMSSPTGNNTTPETPVFAGPEGYTPKTLEVKGLPSYKQEKEGDSRFLVTKKGYAPGTFVIGYKNEGGKERPVISELTRPRVGNEARSPEFDKLMKLGRLAREAGIEIETDEKGNIQKIMLPEDLMPSPEEDESQKKEKEGRERLEKELAGKIEEQQEKNGFLSEIVSLSVEFADLKAKAELLLPHIENATQAAILMSLRDSVERGILEFRTDPNQLRVATLKEKIIDLQNELRKIKEHPSLSKKTEEVTPATSPAPQVPEFSAPLIPEDMGGRQKILDEAYSRENIRTVKKTIQIAPNSGQMVTLEKGGSLFNFEVGDFNKKDDLVTLRKIPGGDTIQIKYEKVKEYLARQEINRQLQATVFAKKENQEQKTLIAPLKDFSTVFNAAQGYHPNAALSWVKRWVESGKIDEFRKNHGNIAIDEEVVNFAKRALPIYIEGLRLPGLNKERKESIIQSIKIYAGVLTGVHHEKINNIANFVDKQHLPEGNLKELERDLGGKDSAEKPAVANQVKTVGTSAEVARNTKKENQTWEERRAEARHHVNRLIRSAEDIQTEKTAKNPKISLIGGGALPLEDYVARHRAEQEAKKSEKVEITDELLSKWHELASDHKVGEMLGKEELAKLTVFIMYDRMFKKNEHAFLNLYSTPEFDKDTNGIRYVSNKRYHMGTEQEREAIRKVFEAHNLVLVDQTRNERREEDREEEERHATSAKTYRETFRPALIERKTLINKRKEINDLEIKLQSSPEDKAVQDELDQAIKEYRDEVKELENREISEPMAEEDLFAGKARYENARSRRTRHQLPDVLQLSNRASIQFKAMEENLDNLMKNMLDKKTKESQQEFQKALESYEMDVEARINKKLEEESSSATKEEREKKAATLKKIDMILNRRIDEAAKKSALNELTWGDAWKKGNGRIRTVLASLLLATGTYYALNNPAPAAEQAPQRSEQEKPMDDYVASYAKDLQKDIATNMSVRDIVAKYAPSLVNKDKPASIDNVLGMDGRKVLYTEGVYNMSEEQQAEISGMLRKFQNLYEATRAPEQAKALARGTPYTYNPPNDFIPGPQTTVKEYMEKIIGEIKKAEH